MSRTNRGFTLVELLIAVVVFSVLASIMYPALHGILGNRDILQQEMERTAALQKAMLILQSDFEQLRVRKIRDQFGDSQNSLITPRNSANIAVEFSRGGQSNPLHQARSSIMRVAYGVKEEKLIRYQWRVLDRAQDSVPLEIALLNDVSSLQFKFLSDKKVWSTQWPQDSSVQSGRSPAVAVDALPRAVEVLIKTKDWGDLRRVFHGVY